MNGILKWVEPHRGSGYITNEDTGLCNRIYHWELGYQIAKSIIISDGVSIFVIY